MPIRGLRHVALLVLLGHCFALPSAAEVQGRFFSKDGAISVFDVDLELTPQQQLELLTNKPAARRTSLKADKKTSQPLTAKPSSVTDAKELSPTEKILAQYGDPSADPPVTAQKDAPAPFQAMLDSLAVNDEKLAYQYAKQFVRYRQRQKNSVELAMALQGLAMEERGVVTDKDWQSSPRYNELRQLVMDQDNVEQAESAAEDKSYIRRDDAGPFDLFRKAHELEQKAQAALEAEEDAVEEVATYQSPEQLKQTEAAKRHQIRQQLAGKVPVDPKGEIDIFFFFMPADKNARLMAKQIEAVHQQTKDSPKVNIVGVTMDVANSLAISSFQKTTKTTFPILSGAVLAQKLEVKQSPTTVLRGRNNGQALYETGVRDRIYLEEVVRAMGGGR